MASRAVRNVLLITVDQWRGDCLGVAGHPVVRTPSLDALALDGVRFARHYAQAAPCGPSRASILTGTYLMNHRVVGNGTPLDARLTNVALEARRAGFDPVLFGYTDQTPDPRVMEPDDPRLRTYEGVIPGFRAVVDLDEHLVAWGEWLRARGYEVPDDVRDLYRPISDDPGAPTSYRAEDSEAAFLTEAILEYFDGAGDSPTFVHAAYIRPHPPFIAPAPYHDLYDPDQMPAPVRHASIEEEGAVHPLLPAAIDFCAALDGPVDDAVIGQRRATYYGMMTEVDAQLGRLFEGPRARDRWDDTLVVLTSDHGEQLGDHWLSEKLGWFDQSYHVPLIVRDPSPAADATRGTVVERFTESVDLMPTILEAIDASIPVQCDGRSLLSFTRDAPPADWRTEVHWEWDFRDPIGGRAQRAFGAGLDECALTVLRDDDRKYVHFGAPTLSPLYYDLRDDPGELVNRAGDPAYATAVLSAAQRMLSWRMTNADRTLTGMMATPKGVLDGRKR